MYYLIILFVIELFFQPEKHVEYRIKIVDNIYCVIPNSKAISKDSTYMRIEIYNGTNLVYKDTSLTDYIFKNENLPYGRKLLNGDYEILLKVFGATDYDKIIGFYIIGNTLEKKIEFPDFSNEFVINELTKYSILSGYMSSSESPCLNCDSCYYNPKLYYRFGDNGIYLDSLLTISENKKIWGGFFGYYLTEKVVLPCTQ